MPRRRFDPQNVCSVLVGRHGMTRSMIGVAFGVVVTVVHSWEAGEVVPRSHVGRHSDLSRLQSLLVINSVLSGRTDRRGIYQWWWTTNPHLDHRRPLELHASDPIAVQRAAAAFIKDKDSSS